LSQTNENATVPKTHFSELNKALVVPNQKKRVYETCVKKKDARICGCDVSHLALNSIYKTRTGGLAVVDASTTKSCLNTV